MEDNQREKNEKREYGRNRYHKTSEKDKQKLKEYQKSLSNLKNEARTDLQFQA